ncbi:hypothetical protein BOTBODRAFT_101794, partial [Botryobasidium botryosum FD-172 SS1]
GSPDDLLQLQSLTVSPDPPQPGRNLTIMASALVREEIEDGAYAHVLVKAGPIMVLSKQFDLCAEAEKANFSLLCPVKPGQYDIVHSVELPREVPFGKFTIQVQALAADDAPMFCLNAKVDFSPRVV